jgi:hypothetical protein
VSLVLRILVILCAVFVVSTLGYGAAVLMPKVDSAKSESESAERRVPKMPPATSWSDMSPAEQARFRDLQEMAAAEQREASKASDRYLDLRSRREDYTIIAMLVGGLGFLLSIAASWNKKKGILVLGIATAVIGVVGHLGITMAQDGHL